jgi:hypothetical protein
VRQQDLLAEGDPPVELFLPAIDAGKRASRRKRLEGRTHGETLGLPVPERDVGLGVEHGDAEASAGTLFKLAKPLGHVILRRAGRKRGRSQDECRIEHGRRGQHCSAGYVQRHVFLRLCGSSAET